MKYKALIASVTLFSKVTALAQERKLPADSDTVVSGDLTLTRQIQSDGGLNLKIAYQGELLKQKSALRMTITVNSPKGRRQHTFPLVVSEKNAELTLSSTCLELTDKSTCAKKASLAMKHLLSFADPVGNSMKAMDVEIKILREDQDETKAKVERIILSAIEDLEA